MNFVVKEIAKAKGLSMEDLAAKLGCTRQNLTSSLSANPTVGTLEKIAGVLGVPVTDLFDEGELPERELDSPVLRVKDILKEKKMTGKDLAVKLGIRESALSLLLNGDPKIGSLIPVAEALGVELSELLAVKKQTPSAPESGTADPGLHGQNSACEITVASPGKFQLKRIMEERRLSITDVANKTGITNANISRILHGKTSPTLETIERIARALGIASYELLRGTPEESFSILRCPNCGAELTVSAEGME